MFPVGANCGGGPRRTENALLSWRCSQEDHALDRGRVSCGRGVGDGCGSPPRLFEITRECNICSEAKKVFALQM